MKAPEENIHSKMILATINCIEEKGVQHTTSREIVKRAGVNLAAINYYFGSKEQLIEIALNQTLDEAFDNMIAEELLQQAEPITALKTLFLEFFRGGLRYPGITKAHLYKPVMEDDYDTLFVRRWDQYVTKLVQRIAQLLPEMTRDAIKMSVIQTVAAITFVCLTTKLYGAMDIDLSDRQMQQKFIHNLVDKNFSQQ